MIDAFIEKLRADYNRLQDEKERLEAEREVRRGHVIETEGKIREVQYKQDVIRRILKEE